MYAQWCVCVCVWPPRAQPIGLCAAKCKTFGLGIKSGARNRHPLFILSRIEVPGHRVVTHPVVCADVCDAWLQADSRCYNHTVNDPIYGTPWQESRILWRQFTCFSDFKILTYQKLKTLILHPVFDHWKSFQNTFSFFLQCSVDARDLFLFVKPFLCLEKTHFDLSTFS